MPCILLIEDDRFLRTSLRSLLESKGYGVTEAQSGDEALGAYRPGFHHLVLTDLNMPGKDGFQTILEIRKITPDIKIIAMSGGVGNSSNTNLITALALGANRILAKPFALACLLDTISELLPASLTQGEEIV